MKKLLMVFSLILTMSVYGVAFAELEVVDGPITAQNITVTGQLTFSGGSPGAGKVLTSNASGLATWQTPTSGMGGSGTTNYFPKFTGTNSIGNSVVYESGSNVGIGTTSPTKKLTVVAPNDSAFLGLSGASGSHTNISVGRTSTDASLAVAASAGQYAANSVAGDAVLRAETSSKKLHLLAGAGDSVLTVTSSNVGIGTNSPAGKLHIRGGNAYVDSISYGGTPTIALAVGDTDTGLHSLGDGQLEVYANDVNVMSIRGAAGVGIGIVPTNYKFEVNGNARVTDLTLLDPNEPVLRLQHSGKTWGSNSGGFIEFYDNSARGGWLGYGGSFDGNLYLTNQLTDKGIKFRTQSTDRMIIDSGGNVGIGTTSPTQKLHVAGNANITGSATITGSTTISGTLGGSVKVYRYDCNDGVRNGGDDDYHEQYCGPTQTDLTTSNCTPFVIFQNQNDGDKDEVREHGCFIDNTAQRLYFGLETAGGDNENTAYGSKCGAICGVQIIGD
ncbi:MAG: hypothetical protein FJZ10_05680 [Candidatus Omnitrophica bacterium]|nr:hypothetical protein [Candidatus Omnitrophota bacterium]